MTCLQRLGTRALIAETLVELAENVQRAVTLLCEAAGSGDLAAAKALVPYLDQALGKPVERPEHGLASSVEELEQLPTAALVRLVAQGRARRLGLRAAPEPAVGESDDATGVDGVDDDVDIAQLLPHAP